MKKLYYIIGLYLFYIGFALAQISAKVNHNQLEIGQSLVLTINLPDNNSQPDLAPLKTDFDIYGTSSNSQTSIINGKITSQASYAITLLPKHIGKLLIPSLKIANDTTAPIAITVTKSSSTSSSPNSVATDSQNEIFLNSTLNTNITYPHVPVILTMKLYFRVNLANLTMDNLNIANLQMKPSSDKPVQYQTEYNHQPYMVLEQKFLLIPNDSGTIDLPPLKISGVMQDANGNGFTFAPQQPFSVNSKPLQLTVKPIPEGFTQANWLAASKLHFIESWSINNESVQIGQAITRNITLLAMDSEASRLPELKFTTPTGVNVYPDKANSSEVLSGTKLQGLKSFKVVYIPTQAGTIQIPQQIIKWWNTTTKQTEQLIIPSKILHISNTNTVTSTKKNLVESELSSTPQLTDLSQKWPYLVILLACFIIATLLVAWCVWNGYRRNRLEPEVIKSYQSTQVTTNKTLAQISEQLKYACAQQQLKLTYSTVLEWFNLLSACRFHSLNEVVTQLKLAKELAQVLNDLESACYDYHQSDFKQWEQLLILINNYLHTTKTKQTKKETLDSFYPD
ncbi:MAG: hypothetical protein RLZZ293_302 [Pseudomonadota bacterium]|jgi:hypothetical protein